MDNHLSRGNSGNRGVNYSEGLHMLPFVCHLRENDICSRGWYRNYSKLLVKPGVQNFSTNYLYLVVLEFVNALYLIPKYFPGLESLSISL